MLDKQIIFIHIPKTAGTTLRTIVYAQYGEASVAPLYPVASYMDAAEFIGLPDAAKDRARVVMGHIGFGFHRHLGRNKAFSYATFVRDPIRRCLSLYNHFRNLHYRGQDVTLKDMLMSPVRAEFNNMQTRLISGHNPPLGDLGETAFEIAVENIEKHFAFVGVTERFDESVVLATHDLGWKLVSYGSRNTAKQWTANFSQDLDGNTEGLALLTELNELDRRLYEYVDARLTERLHRLCPDWETRLADLQQIKEQPSATVAVGNLGKLHRRRIVGWAKLVNRDAPARLKVTINAGHEYIVDATVRREGLSSLTFTGRCGFNIDLPKRFRLKPGDVVSAKVINASDHELNNSPRVFEIDS